MAIEKMSLVSIVGNKSELDEALTECINSNCFHIEQPSKIVNLDEYSEFTVAETSESYSELTSKLYNLAAELGETLDQDVRIDKMFSNDELNAYVDGLDRELNEVSGKLSELNDRLSELELAKVELEHLHGLSVSFDELFSLKHVKIRFGQLPAENYEKLGLYQNRTFYFIPFDNDNMYYWGIYFVPASKAAGVDKIFDSLMFERIHLPDFFHGTTDESIEYVQNEIERTKIMLAEVEKRREAIRQKHSPHISRYYKCIRYKDAVGGLKQYAAELHDNFCVMGYVPSSEVKSFGDNMDKLKTVSCVVQDINSEFKIKPPTKLKNNRFAQPFQGFVEMYGLPGYRGLDPTNLVAITYTLLFGIMFGDVGQGLLISLLGFLAWKLKKMFLGRIMTRIGISSAFFGLVYGSVFGFEDALNPMYKLLFGLNEKPVDVFETSTTNIVLLGAVGLGAVVIIVSIFINIIIGIKSKDPERAFFGSNGIAGLVLYISAFGAAALLMMFNINVLNPAFIIICIVVPVVLMFLREPLAQLCKGRKLKKPEGGVGGFIIENFFELFEFVLSYITNTMSFLRVGGFVLSHAGMMAVVMTLTEMVGSTASPFVIVIGNLFVMGIEGLIVGIQVLRLEFYEIFSRFYDGDGIPFEPVKILYKIEE